MQYIRAVDQRGLGMRTIAFIRCGDIWPAIDDNAVEGQSLQSPPNWSDLDWLTLGELLQYHRQLFSWRLLPTMLKFVRTGPHLPTATVNLHIGN